MSVVVTRARTCPRCHGRFEGDAQFCPRDGTPLEEAGSGGKEEPERDPYLGTVLANDIELKSVAGVGAMGRVYRGHQRGMDRDVAVKILHRELSSNKQLVARFHREARIASKLQHPHVRRGVLRRTAPPMARSTWSWSTSTASRCRRRS